VSELIKKPITIWFLILTIGILAYLLSNHIIINHNITSKGIIYPSQEWTLARNSDGNLMMSLKNNINNSISHYSVTEFQRGDLAEFFIKEQIFSREYINIGDTIGFILSNSEKRKLVEYYGELEVQKELLNFYSSGEKPQNVQAAYERKILAMQEYETQKRIMERNTLLHEKQYIADEEYELSFSQYQIKLQNYNIAKIEHEAVMTGSKPEQLNYVMARITAIEEQINHLENLLSSFTITSPIAGKLVRQQGNIADYDIIARVADTTKYMLITPLDLHHLEYLSNGNKIKISHPSLRRTVSTEINSFDNSIQTLNQRQKIFVNAILNSDLTHIYPNMQVDVKINCGPVTAREYIARYFIEVYNN
jgi:hypothetical protein